MPRYKSVSEFRHSVVIQGKKYLVGPDDVIESPNPLSYIFLQEVDKSVPVTVNTPFAGGHHIQNLKKQVDNLEKEKEQIAQAKVAEVSQTIASTNSSIDDLRRTLESFISKYEKEMQDLTEQINKQFESIEAAENENKKSDREFRDVVNRRLGILKDAVRTVEDEIFGTQEDQPPKN